MLSREFGGILSEQKAGLNGEYTQLYDFVKMKDGNYCVISKQAIFKQVSAKKLKPYLRSGYVLRSTSCPYNGKIWSINLIAAIENTFSEYENTINLHSDKKQFMFQYSRNGLFYQFYFASLKEYEAFRRYRLIFDRFSCN